MERFDNKTVQIDVPVERPVYEAPAIVSYSDTMILELLGPARTLYACDPNTPCP